MKLFKSGLDGGKLSTVRGFWLIEIKGLFSIVLLKFNKGSRENYHSHAFNALTFWIKGRAIEYHKDGSVQTWTPSIIPKYTPRNCFHKIFVEKNTWAISFRGPWNSTWQEHNPKTQQTFNLTHGRKVIG